MAKTLMPLKIILRSVHHIQNAGQTRYRSNCYLQNTNNIAKSYQNILKNMCLFKTDGKHETKEMRNNNLKHILGLKTFFYEWNINVQDQQTIDSDAFANQLGNHLIRKSSKTTLYIHTNEEHLDTHFLIESFAEIYK